jgi:hypothetical protein
LTEKIKSKSAENSSIKVRLRKVNQVCLKPFGKSTTGAGPWAWFFNQGSVKIFQSGSAEKISIKV